MEISQNQNQALDPQVVLLAKAIRQTESGGNFQAKGKSGEFGAYQFMPGTWSSASQKYLGSQIPLDQATPEQQNEVAYRQIKEWKDQGYHPGQIASMWNAGGGEPDAYTGRFSNGSPSAGTNKAGVHFDVPKYATSVATAYQTLKHGGQVGVDPSNPSSIANVQNQTEASSGDRPADGYSLGGFAGNVLKSGGNIVKGLGEIIAHPVRTVENLGNAIQGGVELLIPGEQGHEDQAKAIGGFFADRYGGLDRIKNSFYNDPLGVALDLSTFLTGGGAALSGSSKVAELAGATQRAGELSRIAGGISKVGEVTDPLRMATQGIGKVVGGGGKVASEISGGLTGSGGEAVRSVYQAGRQGGQALQDVTDALRGRLSAEDVLSTAQGALQDLIGLRRQEYLTQFDDIIKADAQAGKSLQALPFDSVVQTMKKQLDNFGIKIDSKTGDLDFSTSSIGDRAAQNVAREVYNDVVTWKDLSPQGLDTLKRRLDSYYKETGDTRALVQATKAETKKVLKDNIKGYEKMTKGYEEASEALKEAQSAVGGPRQTQEQALRKVRSIFRDSQRERLSTVESMESKTGRNIKGQVAGLIMNPMIPGGLAKYVAEGAGITALVHPGAAVGLLPTLITTSPRFVAEVARLMGVTARKLEAMIAVLEKSGLSRQEILTLLFQANRTSGGGQALNNAQPSR